jgi:FkbM family methyltransferase
MALFLPRLKENGYLNHLHLTICNVGSRKLDQSSDYASGAWSHFIPNLSIYGFDADADACNAANEDLEQRNIPWVEHHIPLAISNHTGEATLYVTKAPMCTSLYMPNELYLKRFRQLSEFMNLDFTIEVETITLDEACQREGIEEIDFLQIDVQGADLNVLKGAADLLSRSVLGIQIEVEFTSLYIDQPLFSDVDSFLRGELFTLFFLKTAHRTRATSPVCSPKRPGQMLWGDAIYLRDLIRQDISSSQKTPTQIFKLACISDVLDFPDFTLELLEYLTLNFGTDPQFNYSKIIVDVISDFPDLVEKGIEKLQVIQNIQPFLP